MSVPKFTHTTECDDGKINVSWNGIYRGYVLFSEDRGCYIYMSDSERHCAPMGGFQHADSAITALLATWGIH